MSNESPKIEGPEVSIRPSQGVAVDTVSVSVKRVSVGEITIYELSEADITKLMQASGSGLLSNFAFFFGSAAIALAITLGTCIMTDGVKVGMIVGCVGSGIATVVFGVFAGIEWKKSRDAKAALKAKIQG
jgi:hypothetical protein